MAVFKREGSPHWQIEFTFKGNKVRQSSGTAKKQEAEERERILRQELKEQVLLGKVAEMSLGEAVDRLSSPRGMSALPSGNFTP